MTRPARLLMAVGCASVVLAGCTSESPKAGEASPPLTESVTESQAPDSATESQSSDDFDVTLVPVPPPPVVTPPAAPPTASGSTDTASASASGRASTPPADVKAGRVFAFLRSVDLDKRTLTYDEASFLTGDAAKKAAAADNRELDTDYYIRNVNKRLRTLPVDASAAILGSIAMSGQVESVIVTLETLAAFIATAPGKETGFWVTIKDKKQITRVEEQYLP